MFGTPLLPHQLLQNQKHGTHSNSAGLKLCYKLLQKCLCLYAKVHTETAFCRDFDIAVDQFF